MKTASFIGLVLLLSFQVHPIMAKPPGGIIGPASVTVGDYSTYSVALFATCYSWTVQNSYGYIDSNNDSYIIVHWTNSGTTIISFFDACGTAVASKTITIAAGSCTAPSTPNGTITETKYCGYTTLDFSISGNQPPANVQWYWQTSSSGTSMNSNPYSVSSNGTFYLRALASCGTWSTGAQSFSTTVNPIPSLPISTTGTTFCSGLTGVLSATPGSNANDIHWYTSSGGGNVSPGPTTGLSLTTAVLTNTTNYYVSSRNSTTGCESAIYQTPVVATVRARPGTPLSTTGGYICGTSGQATLSGVPASDANSLFWYDVPTGGTNIYSAATTYITNVLTATTTYYVASINYSTNCVSASRLPVVAVLTAFPGPPSAADVYVCKGQTATLSAIAGANATSIKWYNALQNSLLATTTSGANFTTPVLNAHTKYYISSFNGCESTPRTLVTAYTDNDDCMNWTERTSYASDGVTVVSKSRSYLDGFGKEIQSQSMDASGRVWVTQPLFDNLSNPVALTLPAPKLESVLRYKSDFVQNQDREIYSAIDFDSPSTINNPQPVSDAAGTLGWYYSSQNNLEPAIATTHFPYMRKYEPPGPNPATTKSAAAGDYNRMGTGHEVSTLRSVFVESALHHYFQLRAYFISGSVIPAGTTKIGYKIISTDENGKSIITYSNADELLLATLSDGKWSYSYYNESGQLVAVVAPNGVDTGSTAMPQFVTTYKYDHIGGLIETATPDEGTSQFVYNKNGKLRFSQNQEQRGAVPKRFSYTNYDRLGRLVESGEYEEGSGSYFFEPAIIPASSSATNSILRIVDNTSGIDIISGSTGDTHCKDVNYIQYDGQSSDYPPDGLHLAQTYLIGQTARTKNENSTTWYSYDEFGHLAWMKQSLPVVYSLPIQWINFVNASQNGNVLVKTTGTVWDAGAYSEGYIATNKDGWIEFNAGETNTYKMMGLSTTDLNPGYNGINYAMYPAADGNLYVWENGTPYYPNPVVPYSATDLLRVERQGSTIFYKKNGAIFYTSTLPSSGELHADFSLYDLSATFKNVTMSSSTASQSLQMVNLVHAAQDGAVLKKTGGVPETWDSGGFSIELIAANGWVEFSAGESNTYKMLGLSTTDLNASYSSIHYAMYPAADGNLYVWESGTPYYPNPVVPYSASDILRVERQGTKIFYKKNGVIFYTSTVPSTGALHADYSLYHANATFKNVSMSSSCTYKTVDYAYDYFNNVTLVGYQKGQADAFYHHYEYDVTNRLTVASTSQDGQVASKTIRAKYYYYLHGPLKRVELGNHAQGIDYVYGIDGSLKFINHPDPAKDIGKDGLAGANSNFQSDVFGMALDYYSGDYTGANYPDAGTFSLSTTYPDLFGGAIKAFRWHSQTDSHIPRAYVFNYDNRYQLSNADWGNITLTGNYSFSVPSTPEPEPYKEAINNYDANGNIKTLVRKGRLGNSLANFSYNYGSGTNKLTGILNNNISMLTYQYNGIGQMTQQTEGSNAMKVSYTAYGLTKEIRDANNKLKAKFDYDDRGNRLTKTTYNATEGIDHLTYYTSDASGNILATYDQDVTGGGSLRLIEIPIYGIGRLAVSKPLVATTFYEVNDHLGNVRGVIGDPAPMTYTATMEDNGQAAYSNPRVQELAYFKNIGSTAVIDTYMNHSGATTAVPTPNVSSYTYWKNGFAGITPDLKSVGPAIGLTVQPGDTLDLDAFVKFETKASYSRSGIVGAMSTILGNSFLNTAQGLEVISSATQVFNNGLAVAIGTTLGNGSDPNNLPYAYLYYMLYDRNFNFKTAGWKRVTSAAGFAPGTAITSVHEHLVIPQIKITEPGYIYVFVANETEDARVWFDDLKVYHKRNKVVAGADYYPYGLPMENREITREDYRYGYQGQYSEKDKETSWNAFDLRMYDARVGRWMSTDPENQFASPYLAMGNTPGTGVDPDGGFKIMFDVGKALSNVAKNMIVDATVQLITDPDHFGDGFTKSFVSAASSGLSFGKSDRLKNSNKRIGEKQFQKAPPLREAFKVFKEEFTNTEENKQEGVEGFKDLLEKLLEAPEGDDEIADYLSENSKKDLPEEIKRDLDVKFSQPVDIALGDTHSLKPVKGGRTSGTLQISQPASQNTQSRMIRYSQRIHKK